MSKPRLLEDPDFYRRQSLWLGVSLVLAVLYLVTPLFHVDLGQREAVHLYGIRWAHSLKAPTPALAKWFSLLNALVLILLVFLLGYTLMRYRERKRQLLFLRFGLLAWGVVVLLTGASIGLYVTAAGIQKLMTGYHPTPFLALPLLGMGALVLSQRAIRKDLKRLKSQDRFW